jgi:hypothetical protein
LPQSEETMNAIDRRLEVENDRQTRELLLAHKERLETLKRIKAQPRKTATDKRP